MENNQEREYTTNEQVNELSSVDKINEYLHQNILDEPIEETFFQNLTYRLVKDAYTSKPEDYYQSLAFTLRDRLAKQWLETQRTHHRVDTKRVYYLSMEFLIGRLLKMNIDRLNLDHRVQKLYDKLGIDFDVIEEKEHDAGLGNGGLGRLAACFLDSIAALQIPCFGYGIRYDYGLFKQLIENGYQVEVPDKWLEDGYPWEIERPERYTIGFYGRTQKVTQANGIERTEWVDYNSVFAVPFDIPVPGFLNGTVNTLRLWSAKTDDDFRFQQFNTGDYVSAFMEKINDENITKILYPNDSVYSGQELRLKQEFFFSSASLHDIIRRFKEGHDKQFNLFPDKVVIQLNDTHPAIAIPELVRILVDFEGLNFDEAWKITKRTFAYTNHTLLPEALEKWPEKLFNHLLPRHMEIVYLINNEFLGEVKEKFPGDELILQRMSIIEEGPQKMVRMAHLAVVGSFSVNGVSSLHSELIKTNLFPDFYALYPNKFNNKTNGITPRRWLFKCNHRLSHIITSKIGVNWLLDLYELQKLKDYVDDPSFQEGWQIIKRNNKINLARWMEKHHGFTFDPYSLLDVQVKRIHEYKRQLLNALHIIYRYLKIKENPDIDIVPRTILIGGKAAPSYQTAKLHIKLINCLSDVINNDSDMYEKLKVFFVPNYNVSVAEKIIPATDLSEQISTAGKEASGTGNMKFALNGALTIGTLDGANIEIGEEVGWDNIFIFGLKTEEVQEVIANQYKPMEYVEKSPILKQILEMLRDGFFSPETPELFAPIYDELINRDPYLVLADFEAYIRCQEKVDEAYRDQKVWTKKSIINVASMGKFSSDRTIKEYNQDIWKIEPIPVMKHS